MLPGVFFEALAPNSFLLRQCPVAAHMHLGLLFLQNLFKLSPAKNTLKEQPRALQHAQCFRMGFSKLSSTPLPAKPW